MMKKLPPIQKILEAYTAIADDHVKLGTNQAEVTSSNGQKTYTVTFHNQTYSANDNATYWQGYAGYPILAVLMLQGHLPLNKPIAQSFSQVDWHHVNQVNKRNYAQAADSVMTERQLDKQEVTAEMNRVYDQLKELPLTIKRGSLRPPKAK